MKNYKFDFKKMSKVKHVLLYLEAMDDVINLKLNDDYPKFGELKSILKEVKPDTHLSVKIDKFE